MLIGRRLHLGELGRPPCPVWEDLRVGIGEGVRMCAARKMGVAVEVEEMAVGVRLVSERGGEEVRKRQRGYLWHVRLSVCLS